MSASAPVTPTRPLGRLVTRRLGDAALWLTVAAMVFPFLFALVASLRDPADFAARPLGLPAGLTLDNVVRAFEGMDYARSLGNTLIILVGSVAATIVLGAAASYPLSRITRGWSTALYRFFILGTSIPVFVLMAPLFLLMRDIGLLGSHLGVIVIYTALNLPIAVFFYTSFLRQVPVDLEEAAALDGAGPVRIFFRVVFPIVAPVTATLATYLSLAVWNDFIIPLVFLRGEGTRTIMANAYALLGTNTTDPSILFPAALLGVLPLILVFSWLQRFVVAGMAGGAVKV